MSARSISSALAAYWKSTLLERSLVIAGQIAALSSYGVQLTKESINLPDAQEAAAATREKRKPQWSGQTLSLHRADVPQR